MFFFSVMGWNYLALEAYAGEYNKQDAFVSVTGLRL